MDAENQKPEKKILTPSSLPSSDFSMKENQFISITSSTPIESKDSNFIFLFGKPSVGKSVIVASLLYYMNARAGTLKPKLNVPNTKEAEVLLFDMMDNIRRGSLPNRTTVDQVTRIDMLFEPNNASKKIKPISLTFLEMSGENLQAVRRGGSFHQSIDEYLNADIPLTFLLVTDVDNADEDDSLMISFLNELERKSRHFKKVNAILLITKWDKVSKSENIVIPNEEVLNNFIDKHMPMTSNQIDNYELFKSYYSVGHVTIDNQGHQKLLQLDLTTAKMLTEWIYERITGIDMNYEGTFWERTFKR